MITVKPIDTLKWVGLAIAKDESRMNLAAIYRDAKANVATDGHRLHWEDAIEVATGFYHDGRDGCFPTWSQILPKSPCRILELCLTANVDFQSTLEAIIAMNKKLTKEKPMITILTHGDVITIKLIGTPLKSHGFDLKIDKNYGKETVMRDFEVCLDACYLLDALKGMESGFSLSATSQGSPGEHLGPVLIENMSGNRHAIIMPVRSDRV